MSEPKRCLQLSVLPGSYVIARMPPGSPLPAWAALGDFFSLTATSEELSVVCAARQVPEGFGALPKWRVFKVQGPFVLTEVGVLAALTAPLAEAKVSLFAISTFDT